MKNTETAYEEILSILKKHKDVIVFDVEGLERKANIHLWGLKLKHVFGLNIKPEMVESLDWVRLGEFTTIGLWGEKHNRKISWSVDGRQPQDEQLLQISFPTGAYIFGEDYAVDFFQRFWLELKEFNPDYADEANHCLYWKVENAKDVFNTFHELINKYRELNKEDVKLRRIEKLKKELNQLESKS